MAIAAAVHIVIAIGRVAAENGGGQANAPAAQGCRDRLPEGIRGYRGVAMLHRLAREGVGEVGREWGLDASHNVMARRVVERLGGAFGLTDGVPTVVRVEIPAQTFRKLVWCRMR